MYGLNDEEISQIRDGGFDGFSPAEAALLRIGRCAGGNTGECKRRAVAELRSHFSEQQMIELAASAALENYRARYNRLFDVGSEGLYRKGIRFQHG